MIFVAAYHIGRINLFIEHSVYQERRQAVPHANPINAQPFPTTPTMREINLRGKHRKHQVCLSHFFQVFQEERDLEVS